MQSHQDLNEKCGELEPHPYTWGLVEIEETKAGELDAKRIVF